MTCEAAQAVPVDVLVLGACAVAAIIGWVVFDLLRPARETVSTQNAEMLLAAVPYVAGLAAFLAVLALVLDDVALRLCG
jgi:uncharacterized membrane protein YcfT